VMGWPNWPFNRSLEAGKDRLMGFMPAVDVVKQNIDSFCFSKNSFVVMLLLCNFLILSWCTTVSSHFVTYQYYSNYQVG
jgi:hypothetical protein